MTKWIKTEFNGLRYREHSTRKHGVKPDRYYNIRFQADGHLIDQCLGWASEGMTLHKAALVMADLREELRLGKGSGKLADRRKAQRQAEEEAKAAALEQQRLATTYGEFYSLYYEPTLAGKTKDTARRERELNTRWIIPIIGSRPVRDLVPLDVERVASHVLKAGKAPRTAQYAIAAIRMVLNAAIRMEYYLKRNPVSDARKPKFDNRRVRFLSHGEADTLLAALAERSMSIHNMALLALNAGLRLSEIYKLTWLDVDTIHNLVTIRDTKNGKTRTIPMTGAVREMFQSIPKQEGQLLVFPGRSGSSRRGDIGNTFDKVVQSLGFNDGITDRRQRVTFHTLRHTCASWLAMAGVELYAIKEILGHQTILMTERYSHLCPSRLKAALSTMENALNQSRAIRVVPFMEGGRIHG